MTASSRTSSADTWLRAMSAAAEHLKENKVPQVIVPDPNARVPRSTDLDPDLRRVIAQRAREPFYAYRSLKNSQTRFLADVAGMAFGVYVLLGGNRSGKSKTCSYALARWALGPLKHVKRDTGQAPVLWVVSKTYEDSGELVWKQHLKGFLHPRNIETIAWHNKAKEWPAFIRLHNGVEIVFKSWEQGRGAFQGKGVRGVQLDEQCPEDVFREIQARCVDFKAPIIQGETPIEPDPLLEQRYTDPPDGWAFYTIDIEDNRESRGGYLPDIAVDRFLAENMGTDLYETRKSGALVGLEGAVYKSFRRSIHAMDSELVDEVIRERGGGWRRAWGVDFGIVNPFCCLWGAKDDEGRWWIYDELYEQQRPIEFLVAEIKARNAGQWAMGNSVPQGTYWADTGDQSSTTAGTDYRVSGRRSMAAAGLYVMAASKDMMRGIEAVQKALRIPTVFTPTGRPLVVEDALPMLVISTRCRHLLNQMASLRWAKKTAAGMDPAEKVIKQADHAVDALRYLVFSDKGAGKVEVSVPDGGVYTSQASAAAYGFKER